jgi:Flp pilus assembly protein TadG
VTRFLARFCRDEGGGPAAEFALVVPILLLFLLGIIDVGRLMWTWNQAEKATQMGVRFAVATDPVASGIKTYSYAVDGGIPQGDPILSDDFSTITCNSSACTPCPAYCGSRDATAFGALVARMALFKADITGANVTITYDWSGLGYAGDPNGPDVSPLVTISLQNLTFSPLILFGGTVTLPSFAATLSMEDGDGTTSN